MAFRFDRVKAWLFSGNASGASHLRRSWIVEELGSGGVVEVFRRSDSGGGGGAWGADAVWVVLREPAVCGDVRNVVWIRDSSPGLRISKFG